MEWLPLGWRDGVLLLVALAAVYLVTMLLKLLQISRQRQELPHAEPAPAEHFDTVSPLRQRNEPEANPLPIPEPASRAAIAAYAEAMGEPPPHEPFAVRPAPTFEWDDVKELFGEEVATNPAPAPLNQQKPAAPRAPGFGESLSAHLARSQVEEEIQRMRDEMERMRREMEDLRATRRVSPQYAEAMELAQRGLTAQDVADQLGISLAEAELVHALSRSQQNFDEGEADGAEGYTANSGLRHRSVG